MVVPRRPARRWSATGPTGMGSRVRQAARYGDPNGWTDRATRVATKAARKGSDGAGPRAQSYGTPKPQHSVRHLIALSVFRNPGRAPETRNRRRADALKSMLFHPCRFESHTFVCCCPVLGAAAGGGGGSGAGGGAAALDPHVLLVGSVHSSICSEVGAPRADIAPKHYNPSASQPCNLQTSVTSWSGSPTAAPERERQTSERVKLSTWRWGTA